MQHVFRVKGSQCQGFQSFFHLYRQPLALLRRLWRVGYQYSKQRIFGTNVTLALHVGRAHIYMVYKVHAPKFENQLYFSDIPVSENAANMAAEAYLCEQIQQALSSIRATLVLHEGMRILRINVVTCVDAQLVVMQTIDAPALAPCELPAYLQWQMRQTLSGYEHTHANEFCLDYRRHPTKTHALQVVVGQQELLNQLQKILAQRGGVLNGLYVDCILLSDWLCAQTALKVSAIVYVSRMRCWLLVNNPTRQCHIDELPNMPLMSADAHQAEILNRSVQQHLPNDISAQDAGQICLLADGWNDSRQALEFIAQLNQQSPYRWRLLDTSALLSHYNRRALSSNGTPSDYFMALLLMTAKEQEYA